MQPVIGACCAQPLPAQQHLPTITNWQTVSPFRHRQARLTPEPIWKRKTLGARSRERVTGKDWTRHGLAHYLTA